MEDIWKTILSLLSGFALTRLSNKFLIYLLDVLTPISILTLLGIRLLSSNSYSFFICSALDISPKLSYDALNDVFPFSPDSIEASDSLSRDRPSFETSFIFVTESDSTYTPKSCLHSVVRNASSLSIHSPMSIAFPPAEAIPEQIAVAIQCELLLLGLYPMAIFFPALTRLIPVFTAV